MSIENKSTFEIFLEAIGIYAKHFPTFFKYMSFPVLGQFVGIILSFVLSLGFAFTAPTFINDAGVIFAITLLLTIPGIVIFVKAFWGYLVAYVSVSSMTENTLKSGKIYDIKAHDKVVTSRISQFIVLWLLFGLFTFVAILPPMWVFAGIIFIFIVLVFQVFTFEKNLSPFECFKKSFNLIKTEFWATIGLLILIGLFSYWLLPKIVEIVCSVIQLIAFIAMLLDPVIMNLPINEWNMVLSALNIPYLISSLAIAKFLTTTCISTLVIGYTLPLRTITWTLWYKKLAITEIKKNSKKKKKAE